MKCSRFLEVILLGFFSDKFAEIWAKILRPPKNLPAPTPMLATFQNIGKTQKQRERIWSRCVLCQWRTQKIFMGGVLSVVYGGHLYLVCAVFDVIFMFSSEVCWHNRHILLHALPYFCKKSSPIHSSYNKVFVKYQAQGGLNSNPPSPCVRLCTLFVFW